MVPEELPGSLSSGQRAGAAELARQHAREQVSSCGCREVVSTHCKLSGQQASSPAPTSTVFCAAVRGDGRRPAAALDHELTLWLEAMGHQDAGFSLFSQTPKSLETRHCRHQFKGPAPRETKDTDIVDEAFYNFRPVSSSKSKLQKCNSKSQGEQKVYALESVTSRFPESLVFPFTRCMSIPQTHRKRRAEGLLAAAVARGWTETREECSTSDDEPSKWPTGFVRRQCMNKSLSGPGR
ncbi:hypothetical protein QTO34_002863 [Cnephaeus nilssonii]|uniref:Uncharacterized protein n=1 Tax=Cnephaeus nilssonii TaxID=3371016 RepID=A0AA40HSY0_CNENI|nr:hypothetical protein QTO34_002863 [Eptesicus nilssonii]